MCVCVCLQNLNFYAASGMGEKHNNGNIHVKKIEFSFRYAWKKRICFFVEKRRGWVYSIGKCNRYMFCHNSAFQGL